MASLQKSVKSERRPRLAACAHVRWQESFLSDRSSTIPPLILKKDRQVTEIYQRASLNRAATKIFGTLIVNREPDVRDRCTRPNQGRFFHDRGCADQTFMLCKALVRHCKPQQPTVARFVEVPAAFDSSITDKLLRFLRIWNSTISFKVLMGVEKSLDFALHTAVGRSPSCCRFCLIIAVIGKWTTYGTTIMKFNSAQFLFFRCKGQARWHEQLHHDRSIRWEHLWMHHLNLRAQFSWPPSMFPSLTK